jgi:4-amino-4-deoxy-L-arabinose transferase-like glycosyltransferase
MNSASPQPVNSAASKHPPYALLAVLALLLVVNVASLAQYPMPHCDEASHSNISTNFFKEGRFSRDFLGPLKAFGQNVAVQGRLYHIGKGALLAVLGTTNAAARLFSTLGWVAATGLIYLVGRRLFGEAAGRLSAVVFAASLNVFFASHIAREEIWVAAAVAGMLYTYLVVRERPTRLRYALLGLLMAYALDIHPNSVWFSLPLALLVLIENARSAEGRVRVAWFGLAGVLGIATLVPAHLLPDPAAALENVVGTVNKHRLLDGGPAARLVGQINLMTGTYVRGLSRGVLPFTIYALTGIACALAYRERGDRLLLGLLGGSLVLFTFGMGHKNPYYGVLWDPFGALLIGAAAARLGRVVGERVSVLPEKIAPALLIVPLVGFNLAAQAWLAYKFHPRDFEAYQAAVAAHVPPGEHVMGDTTLWYVFRDRNRFTSDWYLTQYMRVNERPTLTEEEMALIMGDLAVDFVVYDGSVSASNVHDATAVVLEAHLQATCVPVGRVEDRWFGAYGQEGRGQPTVIYDCRGEGD